ncbi:hypothetical protein HDU86_003421 [Geranomyces michiganensis]|nr:hypothetical protein HDU86_003421 [Geranomyces michiganensis]
MPSAPARSPSSPLSRLFHVTGADPSVGEYLFYAHRPSNEDTDAFLRDGGDDEDDDDDNEDDDADDEDPSTYSYHDFDTSLSDLAARADMTLVNSAGFAARSHRGFAAPTDGSQNEDAPRMTAGDNANGGTQLGITVAAAQADTDDTMRFLLSNPGPPNLPRADRNFGNAAREMVRRLRQFGTDHDDQDGDGEYEIRQDHGFVDFGVADEEDSDESSEPSDEENEDDVEADADEDDDEDDEDKTEADLADLEAQFLSHGQSLPGRRRRRRSDSASSTESTSRSWLIDATLLDLVTQIHSPHAATAAQPRRLLRRPAYRYQTAHSSLGPTRRGAMGLAPRWPPLGPAGRRQWRDRVRDLRSSGDSNLGVLLSSNSFSPLSSETPPSTSDHSAIVCAVVSDIEKLFSERMDENGDYRGTSGVGIGRAWEVLDSLGRVDVDRDGQCGAHRRRMRKRRKDEDGTGIRAERVWHVGDAGR